VKKYLLDTNAFWEVLRTWNKTEGELSSALPQDLWQESCYVFSISEITAMEIYSVLGKELRGKPKQRQPCSRKILNQPPCEQIWVQPKQRPISAEIGRAMTHLIRSILLGKQIKFRIEIIPVTTQIVQQSMVLLELYAEQRDFHSLDALIAGTTKTGDFTLITADTKLSKILKLAEIAHIYFKPSVFSTRT
jgi:PIN domain